MTRICYFTVAELSLFKSTKLKIALLVLYFSRVGGGGGDLLIEV